MLADHDFHPDEDTVRLFRTPSPGVLRLDDDVAVTEVLYDGVVLRHYAFARHWFKVNVTTDLHGQIIETGDTIDQFAFNCDISTPMERDGDSVFGVDLFIDLLVRSDARSFHVADEDEFREMVRRGLVSKAEASAAEEGLAELLAMVEAGRLIPWLRELVPFGPCDPPVAPPTERGPVPYRMTPGVRSTW